MDPKAEARLNRIIIRISAFLILLVGIGVLVIEYIFWVDHLISNSMAIIVFVTSITIYIFVGYVVLKNRKKLMNFDEDE